MPAGRIKKYREMRGWSQKELGLRCGFSASTADVRIAQYEKNKKVPRAKALKDIAGALGIDESALYDADLTTQTQKFHVLFDLEDFWGLHPVEKPGGYGYYLEFGGQTVLGNRVGIVDNEEFLSNWVKMRKKYEPKPSDSDEEKKEKLKEYTLWRAEFPHNVAKENTKQIQNAMRMRHLQNQMDELNAQMHGESELARIDEAMESVLPKVRPSCQPMEKESDFIYLVKDLMEQGLRIEDDNPESTRCLEPGDDVHLLSVRTEEILGDEGKKELFARLVCAIESLQQHLIPVSRKITSLEKELYITYSYPQQDFRYFVNLFHHWDDMKEVCRRKEFIPDWELEKYENELRDKITGENDVIFPDENAGGEEE